MEEKKNLLTYEGLKALEDELHDLKVNRRKEVAGKIKEAREQGDLSENAEYDAAKDEQRDIEARIEQIEKILKNAEVVVEEDVDLDKVSIGCTVKVLDEEFDEELEFKIVGMTQLSEMRDSIKEMVVQLPVSDVTEALIRGFSECVRQSKGDTLLRVNVFDREARVALNLFSKSHKVSLSQPLVGYLEENEIKYSIA